MATIDISNLNPIGSELLTDSETYLASLSEAELSIRGGYSPLTPVTDPNYSPLCVLPQISDGTYTL